MQLRGTATGEDRPARADGALRPRFGRLGFLAFKWSVYALLLFNVYLYLVHNTVFEALDSVGWLLLLAIFEWESTSLEQAYSGAWERLAIWGVQLLAYALVLNAWWQYWSEGMWLDFANASLWLLVCATILYDMYVPGAFGSVEWRARNAVKVVLYASLCAIAVWWGIEGDVLNFYDAFLWIVCFFVVELNIFAHESGDAAEAAPNGARDNALAASSGEAA